MYLDYALKTAVEKNLNRLDEIESLLCYPEIQADEKYYKKLLSERNGLLPLKSLFDRYETAINEREKLQTAFSVASPEERALFEEEISALENHISELGEEIAVKLRSSALEDCVCEFAYSGRNETANTLISSLNGYFAGGFTETEPGSKIFFCSGENAKKIMLKLSGVYRVALKGGKSEKFSLFTYESKKEVSVSDEDLRFTLFHSSGAGGQNVNKVETAVRVTHIPTGITTTCQDERSQLMNKERARKNIIALVKKNAEEDYIKKIKPLKIEQSKQNYFTVDLNENCFKDARITERFSFPFSGETFKNYINKLLLL